MSEELSDIEPASESAGESPSEYPEMLDAPRGAANQSLAEMLQAAKDWRKSPVYRVLGKLVLTWVEPLLVYVRMLELYVCESHDGHCWSEAGTSVPEVTLVLEKHACAVCKASLPFVEGLLRARHPVEDSHE